MRGLMAVLILAGAVAVAEEPSIQMLVTAKEKALIERKRVPLSVIVAKAKAAQEERLAKMTPEERAEHDRVVKLSPEERMLEMEKRRYVMLTNEVARIAERIAKGPVKPGKPEKPVVK